VLAQGHHSFSAMEAVCKDRNVTLKNRDAKAELNHRSQACDVLTGTGVRVAKSEPLIRANLR